jgi:hypothetical protein
MIRPLEIKDCPWVRVKAMTLAAAMYPELIADIDKVHWLVRDFATGQTHYARVVGEVGEPRAVLLARVDQNTWAMKKHATVLFWYSEIPGAGAALLRDFRRWADSQQKQIVIAGFNADWVMMDDRPLMVAERIGFKRRGDGGQFYFPRGRHSEK